MTPPTLTLTLTLELNMALRNASETTTATPATNFPPFEDDDTGSSAGSATEVVEAPAAQTAVAVAKPEASAIVIRKPSIDKNTALRGLQNAIPTAELATMAIGVFPRITASGEGFMVDKNKLNLGPRIRVEVLSWNYIHMVTTGEQNNPEANKLIKTGYDEVTLADGTLIADYIKILKAEGYDKTTVKKYAELYVMLRGYMKLEGDSFKKVEVPDEEQTIHQVSLSPQSLGQWGKYLLESGIRKARGHSDDSIVTLVKESKTLGPNTFAMATFTPRW